MFKKYLDKKFGDIKFKKVKQKKAKTMKLSNTMKLLKFIDDKVNDIQKYPVVAEDKKLPRASISSGQSSSISQMSSSQPDDEELTSHSPVDSRAIIQAKFDSLDQNQLYDPEVIKKLIPDAFQESLHKYYETRSSSSALLPLLNNDYEFLKTRIDPELLDPLLRNYFENYKHPSRDSGGKKKGLKKAYMQMEFHKKAPVATSKKRARPKKIKTKTPAKSADITPSGPQESEEEKDEL